MGKHFKILALYEFIFIADQDKFADEIKFFCKIQIGNSEKTLNFYKYKRDMYKY